MMNNSGYLHRVMDALELKKPDKVPFHAYESPEHALRQAGRMVHEMYLDSEILPQVMIMAAKKYANDIIYMRSNTDMGIPEDSRIRETDEGLIFYDKRSGELIGRVEIDSKTFLPEKTEEPLVRSARDINKIPIIPWQELIQQPKIQNCKPYLDEFKGKRFLFGFACAQSANTLDLYLGTEQAMLATINDPCLCRALMERKFEVLKEQILALKTFGADGVYTGDACASCSFYSPATYRELFFEFQKKSIDFVHEQGMKALLHICGRSSPILELMADTGADVIESLDAPSAGGDIELSEAKRRIGSRVCLKGNIDAVHVIEPGGPEVVYAACMKVLEDTGPEGYILSTEQITRDTPAEHVMAMVQARDDYSAR